MSRPRRQSLIASMPTPALFGESVTDNRNSTSIGNPPNPSPSILKKQSLLSFCQGT
jgi:hypothetical protein